MNPDVIDNTHHALSPRPSHSLRVFLIVQAMHSEAKATYTSNTENEHRSCPLLLSRNLSSLSKVDKNEFVASYLKEQRAHAKAYASKGRADSSMWYHRPSDEREGSDIVRLCGFGTPVLKPRVPQNSTREASPKHVEPPEFTSNSDQPRRTEASPRKLPVAQSPQAPPLQKAKPSRKRHTSEDEESMRRLTSVSSLRCPLIVLV